jgi:hypothetical protein
MYRVIMNGSWEDFKTVKQACKYLEKKWNENTHIADIRIFTKNNLLQELRTHNYEKT